MLTGSVYPVVKGGAKELWVYSLWNGGPSSSPESFLTTWSRYVSRRNVDSCSVLGFRQDFHKWLVHINGSKCLILFWNSKWFMDYPWVECGLSQFYGMANEFFDLHVTLGFKSPIETPKNPIESPLIPLKTAPLNPLRGCSTLRRHRAWRLPHPASWSMKHGASRATTWGESRGTWYIGAKNIKKKLR